MNPFQAIKNRMEANAELKNEQQRQRIERLAQLEAEQNRKGFHIPNPVQSMRTKKEIKQLKKEIATFEQSQRNTKVVIGSSALVVVLICLCLIMATIENSPPSNMPETTDNVHSEGSAEIIASSAEEIIESSAEKNNDSFFNWLNKHVPEFEFELNDDGKSYALID